MTPEAKASIAFNLILGSLMGMRVLLPKLASSHSPYANPISISHHSTKTEFPCTHLLESWPVVFQDDVLGQDPVVVGSTTIAFNYPKQQTCFFFNGNPALGISITPDRKCLDMKNPDEKKRHFYVKIKYGDGTKRVMDIDGAEVVGRYARAKHACEAPPIVPAPPFQNPQWTAYRGRSFSL